MASLTSTTTNGGSAPANQQQQPESTYLDSKIRVRVSDLKEAKRRQEKWAMLTTYDTASAKVFDMAKIPCLLIGDSAGQVVLGYKSTLPVTVDELIPLARAVAASCERALVIADLPFGSYQESPELALKNSIRFMKEAQVHGVKLEGGAEFAPHVKLLAQSGVPVMAHIGFTPQSEHALSGFKIQGRADEAKARLINDAVALQEAGAFACVIELVPNEVSQAIKDRLDIPVIGIGAGPYCDAQTMVWNDFAGFTAPKRILPGANEPPTQVAANGTQTTNGPFGKPILELSRVPKFVRRYANMSEILYKAALAYQNDVRTGSYPAEEHCYK